MTKADIINDLSEGKSLTEIQKRLNLSGFKNSAISAILIELLSSSANSEGSATPTTTKELVEISEAELDFDVTSQLNLLFRKQFLKCKTKVENDELGSSDLAILKSITDVAKNLTALLKEDYYNLDLED
jgi:hypothetical protein